MVTEAAVTADESEMLQKSVFRDHALVRHELGWRGRGSATFSAEQITLEATGSFKSESKTGADFDNGKVCNYCHQIGHWKADCAILQARNKMFKLNMKPAAAVVPCS